VPSYKGRQKPKRKDVLETLGNLFIQFGIPRHIRSDNGSEFIAVKLREWLQKHGVKTL